jgi:transaldolase
MTRLHQLFEEHGQSPWLDNLKRSYITSGELKKLVDDGVRGVTSNPTIFAKAIESSSDYDEQFGRLAGSMPVEDAYWQLVERDIRDACGVLAPLHEQSEGLDGFVSVEVSPSLAHDTAATVEAARSLHERLELPNVFVKIPATAQGVPAIRQMISEGRSINVTLIFSLDRYREVIDAYLSGLEAFVGSGGDPGGVSSVASFFVSRVDTNVDRRLEAIADGAEGPLAARARDLRGKAAIAQAKLAYQLFLESFRGKRWDDLAARGARVQRPLWASTSTKNPAYADLDYVDNLIGPQTVNTMPDATLADYLDHGRLARTVDAGLDAARAALAGLAEIGIDMAEVSRTLEDEGVATFEKSFEELVKVLSSKANALKR